MLVTNVSDGPLKLWKRADGVELKTLVRKTQGKGRVWFSSDGKHFITASEERNGSIQLWRGDGTRLKILASKSPGVVDLTFSPDGEIIVLQQNDDSLQFWRVDGTQIKSIQSGQRGEQVGHRGNIVKLKFSPDSQLLATASLDNTVKLWSRNGTLLTTLTGHESGAVDINFSPNSSILTTVGGRRNNPFLIARFLKSPDEDLNDLETLQKVACNWLADYLQHNLYLSSQDKKLCSL